MRTLSEYNSMQNRSPSLRVSHQIQIHRSSRQKSRLKFLSHLLFWRELGWIWNRRLTRRSGLLWLYLERLRMGFLRNFEKKKLAPLSPLLCRACVSDEVFGGNLGKFEFGGLLGKLVTIYLVFESLWIILKWMFSSTVFGLISVECP